MNCGCAGLLQDKDYSAQEVLCQTQLRRRRPTLRSPDCWYETAEM